MFPHARSILPAIAVVLLAATPAVILLPGVKDEAKFFSGEAVQKANQVILEIKDKEHKDLLIETFKTVPDDRAEKVKTMDPSERERFFEEWGHERARQQGVNGVYVLICKEPGHVQVEVGNETRQRAFTIENRDHLRDILVNAFKAKEHGRGLLEGVEYVRDTMKENLRERADEGAPATPPPDGPEPTLQRGLIPLSLILGVVCVGVLGLLAVIALVLVFLMRRASRSSGPGGYGPGGYAPGGGYGSGGGGGFLSNMVASLFGAAAGNWVYDRFFRGGGPSMGGGYNSAPPAARPDISDRPDTDYSGAGGDFGPGGPSDQGGGGDVDSGAGGGGDFGGGDVGGGDFGGGGGDAGGGGDF